MPAGPAPGRTVEQAAAEELAARTAAAAERWDPWLELLLPILVVGGGFGSVAAVAALWAVIA